LRAKDIKLDSGRVIFGPHNQFQHYNRHTKKTEGEGPWIEGDMFDVGQEKARELVLNGSAKILEGGMFSICDPDSEFPRFVTWR